MTLIASLKAGSASVLIADRLLTSQDGRSGVYLPTVGVDHLRINMVGGGKTHDLARKLVIVTPNVLVAWAGVVSSAARVVGGIKFAAENYSEDPWVIRAYLQAEYSSELADVIIIIHSRRPNGIIDVWTNGNGCREMSCGELSAWYAGTGAGKFELMVRQFDPSLLSSNHPSQQAAIWAVSVGAQFLAEEIVKGGTLEQRFGGAYDYVLFQKGGPVWIYDITYVFWRFVKNGDAYPVNIPSRFIKHINLGRYGGDVAIYSAGTVVREDGTVSIEGESYSISDPALQPLVQARPRETLRSVWQAVVFIFEDGDNCAMKTHVTCRPNTDGHLIDFGVNEGSITMGFDLAAVHALIGPFVAQLETRA